MKDGASNWTKLLMDNGRPIDDEQNAKGKEGMYASKGVMKKMLLAKKEPFYFLPTNIIFLEKIPRRLPPIKGIEHESDFTIEATLPNKVVYRAILEEIKEIQKQAGKLLKKGWVRESKSLCSVPITLVPKKDRSQRKFARFPENPTSIHASKGGVASTIMSKGEVDIMIEYKGP
ncbi:hypothetical protein CR513_15395, partial [Mucuna pruriens]